MEKGESGYVYLDGLLVVRPEVGDKSLRNGLPLEKKAEQRHHFAGGGDGS